MFKLKTVHNAIYLVQLLMNLLSTFEKVLFLQIK